MSAPFFVPFNFDPVETVFTTTKTIDAGTYASVFPLSPNCKFNDELVALSLSNSATVNGEFVAAPPGFSGRISTSNQSANKSISYVYGSTAAAIASTTGTGTLSVFFLNGVASSFPSGTVTLAASSSLSHIGLNMSASTTVSVQVYNPSEFWVKEGDVLEDGLWRVTIYNKVS